MSGVQLLGCGSEEEPTTCRRLLICIEQVIAARARVGHCLQEPRPCIGGSRRISGRCNQYRKALELDPKSAEAHLNLGRALRAAVNLDEATPVLKKAVELDPKLETARTQLGFALSGSGKPARSHPRVQESSGTKPQFLHCL